MGFLQDLIGRAQGFLGARQTEPVKATDAVKHDRFDGAMFKELIDEAPALADMVEDLNGRWNYTDDMVRDVLMEFWQGDPQHRTADEMKPGWLTNHAVAGHVLNSPETQTTRGYTVHDKYGAAMATLAVNQKVKDFLEEYGEEAQEAAEQAEQAEQAQQAAQEALEQAAEAAAQCEWPEIGPPSPQASQAAQALADALAEAGNADAAAQDAAQAAQEAAAQAQQALRGPINEAIKEAGEQLEEEAALMGGFGVDPGTLQRMPYKERAALAARLRNNRLSGFMKIIGRFRMMAAAERTRKVEYGRDEVVGVEFSNDLSALVPSELAYFASHPALRRDFLVRLAEGRLLTREFKGVERVGKGAIICAFDGSGSMASPDKHGIPREVWAKAMTLALLDQARASKRDFVAIQFGSAHEVRMWDFPKGQASMEDILEFTEFFFNGGTNFESPLNKAIDKLEKEHNADGKMKGDIVFITDGVCGVSEQWMRKYQEAKRNLGFRTFGIKVGEDQFGSHYGDVLGAISDNVRDVTEFADPSTVADVFRVIE